jgi:predicted RNA-binding protein associated with RNAse of E/G family
MRWSPGDAVALREIWRGRVWGARAATVVADTEYGTMFHVPHGAAWKVPVDAAERPLRLPTDDWSLADGTVTWRILSFAWPDVAYAVLAFWRDEDEFLGWYVNLQSPLRRTPIGFDTPPDHALDVVVAADRSTWTWKDEDELEEAVAAGLFSSEDAARFRVEGERAARAIIERMPPFDEPWEDWRPDPAWELPELPEGWDRVDPD